MDTEPAGPLSAILANVPGRFRPIADAGLLLVLAASAIAVVLNPILELIQNIRGYIRRRATPATEPPTPPAEPPQTAGRVTWLSRPVQEALPPLEIREGGVPIITFANMKGGVGKTTLAANLAAYFDKSGKRVLLIDFDYQGSLSSTVLAEAKTSRFQSVADDLILGEKEPLAIMQGSQTLFPAMPRSRVFTCYYDFSNTETFVLANWLMNPSAEIRFRLSKFLRSDAVRKEFDIVLIDAGPRFTTSTINALTASTHLLIPTILDQMSAQAVGYFSKELDRHRNQLFPKLKLLGCVPTFVTQDPTNQASPKFNETEQAIVDQLTRELEGIWGGKDHLILEARVPRRADFAKIAGYGIAYLHDADAERVFARAGQAISKRLKNEGFKP